MIFVVKISGADRPVRTAYPPICSPLRGTKRATVRRVQPITAILGAALVLVLTGAPPAQADPDPSNGGTVTPAIIGGTDATHAHSFMVSIQDAETFCGGSLVSPTWVVTAWHCVQNHTPEELKLRIGSLKWQTGGQERGSPRSSCTRRAHTARTTWHCSGSASRYPAHRSGSVPGPAAGTPARLIGWGCTAPGQAFCTPPYTLQQLDSALRPASACDATGHPIDPATEVCAGNPDTLTGPCRGDFGGPLLVPGTTGWRLLGAFSQTNDIFCQDGKGVCTDVAAYRTWIESVTGPLPDPGIPAAVERRPPKQAPNLLHRGSGPKGVAVSGRTRGP